MENPTSEERTFARLGDDRRNRFNAIRLALALVVLWSHCYPLVFGDNAVEPLFAWTGGRLTAGQLAVHGFFFLSGYLITLSWHRRPETVAFFRNRFLRIVPGYLAALLLSLLVITPLYVADEPILEWGERVWRFITAAVTLRVFAQPDLFVSNPLPGVDNGSLWTIRYEAVCYLLAAAIGCLALSLRQARVVVTTILLGLVGTVLLRGSSVVASLPMPDEIPSPEMLCELVPPFAIGALAFRYRDRIPSDGRWSAPIAIVFISALLGGGAVPVSVQLLVVWVAGGWLLLRLAAGQRTEARGRLAGVDLSYGAYLFVYPMQQVLVYELGWLQGRPNVLFIAAVGPTLVCAAFSWFVIEKPALGLRARRRVVPPAPQAQVARPKPAGVSW